MPGQPLPDGGPVVGPRCKSPGSLQIAEVILDIPEPIEAQREVAESVCGLAVFFRSAAVQLQGLGISRQGSLQIAEVIVDIADLAKD